MSLTSLSIFRILGYLVNQNHMHMTCSFINGREDFYYFLVFVLQRACSLKLLLTWKTTRTQDTGVKHHFPDHHKKCKDCVIQICNLVWIFNEPIVLLTTLWKNEIIIIRGPKKSQLWKTWFELFKKKVVLSLFSFWTYYICTLFIVKILTFNQVQVRVGCRGCIQNNGGRRRVQEWRVPVQRRTRRRPSRTPSPPAALPWRKCRWWRGGASRCATAAFHRQTLAPCGAACRTLRSGWTCADARGCLRLDAAPSSQPVDASSWTSPRCRSHRPMKSRRRYC